MFRISLSQQHRGRRLFKHRSGDFAEEQRLAGGPRHSHHDQLVLVAADLGERIAIARSAHPTRTLYPEHRLAEDPAKQNQGSQLGEENNFGGRGGVHLRGRTTDPEREPRRRPGASAG
jgi:hypothetical protein